jgi:hypothetical protein
MIVQNKIIVNRDKKIFEIYVNVLNILERFNLTKTQKAVYCEFLYRNFLYKEMTESERTELLFSASVRKDISKELDLDVGTFNNVLSLMRNIKGTKGNLIVDKTLNFNYCIYPDKTNKIIIQLDKYDDSVKTDQ